MSNSSPGCRHSRMHREVEPSARDAFVTSMVAKARSDTATARTLSRSAHSNQRTDGLSLLNSLESNLRRITGQN
jgi:hypothetical protein